MAVARESPISSLTSFIISERGGTPWGSHRTLPMDLLSLMTYLLPLCADVNRHRLVRVSWGLQSYSDSRQRCSVQRKPLDDSAMSWSCCGLHYSRFISLAAAKGVGEFTLQFRVTVHLDGEVKAGTKSTVSTVRSRERIVSWILAPVFAFCLDSAVFFHSHTIQGPAYEMEPPTFMLDLLTSLVISTTLKKMPTGQPDLDSSSLRLPLWFSV